MRYFFLLILFSCGYNLSSQHLYRYELNLQSPSHIEGKAHIVFHNQSGSSLNSVEIHLPPRALSWKNSFFRQQYLEFQKTDLHFASEQETGSISLRNLSIARQEQAVIQWPDDSLCLDCEFVKLPLLQPLQTGDSLVLSFAFDLWLPQKKWLGSYSSKSEILLSDWLPEIPALDSSGFHNYPETWQRDRYCQNNQYEVVWNLPDRFIVASNATLQSADERQKLLQQAARPFSQRPPSESNKRIHFQHLGTSLSFVIAENFNVFEMANGGLLFMQRKDAFLPSILDTVDQRIDRYMLREFGLSLTEQYNLVVLEQFSGNAQSDQMIILGHPANTFQLSRELCEMRFQCAVRYRDGMNGFKEVWLARGIPYYYKYHYIETAFPDEFWTPFQDIYADQWWQPAAHNLTGWFLALNQFEYAYQNQYLYLFLARQGLDQPLSTPADSLTRLNYGAIALAKSYLALNHLRAFAGETDFKRGMNRFLANAWASVAELNSSISYFHNRDLDWFFRDWLPSAEAYDYRLKKFDYCPTVATVKVKDKGRLSLPYSVTGYKNGSPVLTEWFPGHEGTLSRQVYHEKYDKVRINDHGRNAEWNLKDNYYGHGLLPRLKPIKLQFYQSFEDPRSTQIFWMPNLAYNAYDKLLLQLDLYNYGLVTRPWEWYLGPSLSTGTGKLTGSASLERNFIPRSTSIFHRISGGIYMRYYHYDEDLAFLRISPAVSFRFRKPYPRSTVLQRIRLRSVHVQRELPPEFQGVANSISNASYTVVNLTHRYEETRLIRPFTIRTDLLVGNQFSRLDLTADFRWMLPNRRWLIWRSFGGVFLSNQFSGAENQQNYFSLGLSGTQDFMFDYYFIGRSDETGIWSRQFFVTDGGFKTETDLFANQFMLATNLSVPIWQVFGVFGDLALADNARTLHYDYGIRVSLLTDFFEVYFPLGYNDRFFPTEANYGGNIRYVLNLDLDAILHRLRRGYY